MFVIEGDAAIGSGDVAVVLRELHEANLRAGVMAESGFEGVGLDDVIGVDNEDEFGAGVHALADVVHGAGFEAGEFFDVEKAEARAEAGADFFEGLPEVGVFGVVIDDDDFEVWPVELGEAFEGLRDEFRGFVVRGHLD